VAHPRPIDGLGGVGAEGLDAARWQRRLGARISTLKVDRIPQVAIAARSQADPIRENPTGTREERGI